MSGVLLDGNTFLYFRRRFYFRSINVFKNISKCTSYTANHIKCKTLKKKRQHFKCDCQTSKNDMATFTK